MTQGMKDSPDSDHKAAKEVALEELVDAALDQPKPTPELRNSLRKMLKLVKHPLSMKPQADTPKRRYVRKQAKHERITEEPADKRGRAMLANLLARAGLPDDARRALATELSNTESHNGTTG
jgi:hypothetical protein